MLRRRRPPPRLTRHKPFAVPGGAAAESFFRGQEGRCPPAPPRDVLDAVCRGCVRYGTGANARSRASSRRAALDCISPLRAALVPSGCVTWAARWRPPERAVSVAGGEAAAAQPGGPGLPAFASAIRRRGARCGARAWRAGRRGLDTAVGLGSGFLVWLLEGSRVGRPF